MFTFSDIGLSKAQRGFLDGQVLIAMPGMSDPRFANSVIYICAHSEEGAMGLVINKAAQHINFSELLGQLDLMPGDTPVSPPEQLTELQIHSGGPVETGRGFILHGDDYFVDKSTLPVDNGICLTATLEVLRAVAQGTGPAQLILALGYAGWGPGQLEAEICANGWLNCQPDNHLLFETDLEDRYNQAVKLIGIDLAMLSTEAGHA